MGNYLSVGNYQFLKQHYFAQGSYGTVYQGRSKSNNHTKVAIKVLKPLAQQVTGSQYYDIIQQFRLLRQLQSTGIVQVYDWDIIRFTEKIRKFAIVMEMMDGTLRDLMVNYRKQNNGHQKIDQKMAKEWIKKIIKSYKSLYDQTINGQHIIHRDLKPENILYFKDANGEINFKLGDFGIARIQNYKNTLTHGKGAAWYISPQQANKKAGKYTTKTDVYSVGVIYFELLNKKERPPIQQQSINFLNRNRNFQLLQNKQDLLHQIKFENLKQQRQIQTKTKMNPFLNQEEEVIEKDIQKKQEQQRDIFGVSYHRSNSGSKRMKRHRSHAQNTFIYKRNSNKGDYKLSHSFAEVEFKHPHEIPVQLDENINYFKYFKENSHCKKRLTCLQNFPNILLFNRQQLPNIGNFIVGIKIQKVSNDSYIKIGITKSLQKESFDQALSSSIYYSVYQRAIYLPRKDNKDNKIQCKQAELRLEIPSKLLVNVNWTKNYIQWIFNDKPQAKCQIPYDWKDSHLKLFVYVWNQGDMIQFI